MVADWISRPPRGPLASSALLFVSETARPPRGPVSAVDDASDF